VAAGFVPIAGAGAVLLVALWMAERAKAVGAVGAVAGAAALVSAWVGARPSLTRGAVLALLVPLGGFVVYGYLYSPEDPLPRHTIAVILLAACPALGWVGDLPGIRRLPRLWRNAIRFAAIALI